jgi:hypothetical protein
MTTLLFSLAVWMIGISLIMGLIGYHWKAGHWSSTVTEYFTNLAVCILHAACWYAGLRLYLRAFGVPEVVEY